MFTPITEKFVFFSPLVIAFGYRLSVEKRFWGGIKNSTIPSLLSVLLYRKLLVGIQQQPPELSPLSLGKKKKRSIFLWKKVLCPRYTLLLLYYFLLPGVHIIGTLFCKNIRDRKSPGGKNSKVLTLKRSDTFWRISQKSLKKIPLIVHRLIDWRS